MAEFQFWIFSALLKVLSIDVKTSNLVKYVREVSKKVNQADRLERGLAQYCVLSGQSLIWSGTVLCEKCEGEKALEHLSKRISLGFQTGSRKKN